MSFGYGFSLPNWQTLSGGFSPASLFAAGEQGVWYDPSDLTTLFQDSAGTTPVTAIEQPVGLMLDKSKGLALGSELVTNGDFSSGTTGWTASSATLSVVSGQLSVVPSTTFGYAYQTLTTVVGVTYKITFNFDQSTAAIARYFVGTTLGGSELIGLTTVSGVGSISRYFTATTTTTYVNFGAQNSSGLQALFDNISVKALPGNHATQSNNPNRPVLSARVNLLTKTEAFDDAAVWLTSNCSVATTTATTDPLGGSTAEIVTAAAGTLPKFVRQIVTVSPSVTFSVYIKNNTQRYIQLFSDGDVEAYANFDVLASAGQTGTKGTKTTSSITDVGNGWYRCVATFTSATAGVSVRILFVDSASAGWFANSTGTGSYYIWGADLRVTNTGVNLPAYQYVNTSTDYSTAGFPLYLQFNGTNYAMASNSIDFTATDKMTVWSGVRKLSATSQVMSELSTNVQTNAGSFVLASAFVSATGYDVQVNGSSRNARYYETYTAPVTNVISSSITTAAADSASAMQTNVNASVNAGVSFLSVVSTGNYGNYPIYVGARAGTSLYLNGQLYSLIVRGAQSSASQISATETWVNGKTKAY